MFSFFHVPDVPECSVFLDFNDGHFKLVTYIKAINVNTDNLK